uniref:HGWP repeat containing protein-like n=1 Tax=Oryza sativa subsp. japonica TaxID=39947 RepID=Q6K1U5_ORYSJ|nr:HGWP repeat containing protein-like [Oryza sativa Japonica Group]BAD22505.1 HGWP repeat containing protein-like [Oryza sativa Japonica Group]
MRGESFPAIPSPVSPSFPSLSPSDSSDLNPAIVAGVFNGAEISAAVSSLSGRALPLSALYICSPCLPPPFPPFAACSRHRIRARDVHLSLRRRRRPPVRRRRRSGLPPVSASPPSASPRCRRPRPPLRFARRPPELRRPRHPEPRRRVPPLRSSSPPSSCLGVSRGPSLSLPSPLRSLGRRSAAPVVAGGDHRGAGAPPPVGRAGEAAFGRAPRLPSGARPSAARARGCG